jgi:membrane-bound inhibitor of C-type lysozyme
VTCGGADGAMAITFVNVDPPMSYLAWGDTSLVMTLGQSGSGARYVANAGGKAPPAG